MTHLQTRSLVRWCCYKMDYSYSTWWNVNWCTDWLLVWDTVKMHSVTLTEHSGDDILWPDLTTTTHDVTTAMIIQGYRGTPGKGKPFQSEQGYQGTRGKGKPFQSKQGNAKHVRTVSFKSSTFSDRAATSQLFMSPPWNAIQLDINAESWAFLSKHTDTLPIFQGCYSIACHNHRTESHMNITETEETIYWYCARLITSPNITHLFISILTKSAAFFIFFLAVNMVSYNESIKFL